MNEKHTENKENLLWNKIESEPQKQVKKNRFKNIFKFLKF
jgi:hypothetical protein